MYLFIRTWLKQITLAWLCMQTVIRFPPVRSHFLSPFFTCIINKWHLDFIKVPRPLWQHKVTGGHFNISRKAPQLVLSLSTSSPSGGGGKKRGAMSQVTAAWKAACRQEPTTVLSKSKCIRSLAQFSLISPPDPPPPPTTALLCEYHLFSEQQIDE